MCARSRGQNEQKHRRIRLTFCVSLFMSVCVCVCAFCASSFNSLHTLDSRTLCALARPMTKRPTPLYYTFIIWINFHYSGWLAKYMWDEKYSLRFALYRWLFTALALFFLLLSLPFLLFQFCIFHEWNSMDFAVTQIQMYVVHAAFAGCYWLARDWCFQPFSFRILSARFNYIIICTQTHTNNI